jgi:hypothetical protein
MKVYVVTNPELGWDCVVGVFSDKDYVYSKYSSDTYVINAETVSDNKYVSKSKNDLIKYGRTDFKYKVVEASNIKYLDDFKSRVTGPNGEFQTYNIIDPEEGEFIIKFSGIEQEHTIENLSVIADLFCDYTKIDKDSIVIFKEKDGEYYLGTKTPFQDDIKLWQYFKEKNVELYY